MSKYNVDCIASTITSGLLVTALLVTPYGDKIEKPPEADVLRSVYMSCGPAPTYDQHRSSLTREFIVNTDPLVTTMSITYENLLNKQEPLGAAFQRVLSENLWDLYES